MYWDIIDDLPEHLSRYFKKAPLVITNTTLLARIIGEMFEML
jgi:hypothetical protein